MAPQVLGNWLGICFVLLLFLVGIPCVMTRLELHAHPTVRALDWHELNPRLADFLMTVASRLLDLGFEDPTLLRMSRTISAVVPGYAAMFHHPVNGDVASIEIHMLPGRLLVGHRPRRFVAFTTRFEDGAKVVTSNINAIPDFPPAPLVVRTWLPGVDDVRQLYELHQFILRRHQTAARRLPYEPGEAFAELLRLGLTELYEPQVQRGWLTYDQRRDSYHLTLRGAYRLFWRILPPCYVWQKLVIRRRARAILEESRRATG